MLDVRTILSLLGVLVFLAGVAIFLVSLLCADESQNQVQRPQPQQEQTDQPTAAKDGSQQSQSGTENQKEPSEKVEPGFKGWIVANEKWLNALSTAFIAIFTVILAIGTIALYSATKSLVQGAEDTAERQLRAYVVGRNGVVSKFGSTELIDVAVDIANAGQTPAYDLELNLKAGGGYYENPNLRDFPARPKASFVLGPGQSVRDVIQLKAIFNPVMVQEVLDGKAAIFLVGEITYKDIFQKRRTTKLQFIYGGPKGAHPGGFMTVDKTGNDAD
jgi:hypothetical protein